MTWLRARYYMIAAMGGFSPLSLFAASEPGFWFDPSDLSTLFQDTAGTTPVTAAGQSVARINDKSGRGNHATQSTSLSRPTLGRNPSSGTRNLLTYTEEFDNASWTKSRTTVTANATTSPDGTVDADKLVEDTTASSTHRIFQQASKAASSLTRTFSVYLKASERTLARLRVTDNIEVVSAGVDIDLAAGTIGTAVVSGGSSISSPSATIVPAGNGWYRVTLTATLDATITSMGAFVFLRDGAGNISYTGDGTSGIFVWGAQLETDSTATAYQKVVSSFDVTEAGKADCWYLGFDGSDDFLVTPTITPGTDKAQVFAGVRKLSDAARGMLVELGNAPGLQTWRIEAPDGPALQRYLWNSSGSSSSSTVASGYAAPITNVLTCIGDIANDTAILRVNGAQAASSTGDQGTGNYLAYPAYIGRRGGTLLPFNGRIYSLICRFGPNLTADQIAQTEAWVNSKTGAY